MPQMRALSSDRKLHVEVSEGVHWDHISPPLGVLELVACDLLEDELTPLEFGSIESEPLGSYYIAGEFHASNPLVLYRR